MVNERFFFGVSYIFCIFANTILLMYLTFWSYKMKLNRELCASSLRSGAGGTRREFLDALAPRRDCSRGRSQQSWQDDSLGCWLPIWYCPFITSTSVASLLPFLLPLLLPKLQLMYKLNSIHIIINLNKSK